MTTETMLAIDALKRDLDRYHNSVDEVERKRIEARMIDTATEATKCNTDHDQVMEMINLIGALYQGGPA